MMLTRELRTKRSIGAGAAVVALALATGCGAAGSGRSAADSHSVKTTVAPQPAYTPPVVPEPTYHTANGLPPGVLSEIKVEQGSAPVGLVVGDGSVWATAHRGTDVYRIDPTTDKVVATIDIGHEACGRPLVAGAELWVTPCDDSSKTTVVSTTTNQVVAGVRMGDAAVYVDGSVWGPASNGKTMLEVSTKTFKVQATVAGANGGSGASADAAYDGRYIWADDLNESGRFNGTLVKIDPATKRVVTVLHTPPISDGAYITYAYGSLWLKGEKPQLLRVNPSTGSFTESRVSHDFEPSQFGDIWIAPGLGSLWMRTSDDQVARIDPKTLKVIHRYRSDENGDGGFPLVAFGSLWTANFGSDSVWRIRIAG